LTAAVGPSVTDALCGGASGPTEDGAHALRGGCRLVAARKFADCRNARKEAAAIGKITAGPPRPDPDFRPDPAVFSDVGLDRLGFGGERDGPDPVLTVVRPPPETSEYHADNPAYEAVIDRLGGAGGAVTVAIPRTEGQARRLRERGMPSLIVPGHAVDAQSLIAYADLVVSAGGTMNREAVALGTPVYTIFSGRMGAVDEKLIAEGKLRELSDPAAIELVKREAGTGPVNPRDPQPLVDAALSAA
jgi:hypothetical protein